MRRLPALSLAGAALALGVVTIGLLSYFSIHLASNAVRHEVVQRAASTDAIAASLIKTDTDGLVDLVRGYASRPSLLAALETGGRSAARDEAITSQLRELRLARPGVATTFLAAPSGRLLAIDPATPSIVGKDFSFRDWYRGVSRTGDAYVSRAFVSLAAGHPLVVAAAVQVRRRPGGPVLAILVAAYRLSHFQQVVDTLSVEEGVSLTVTDQHGVLLAEPAARSGLQSLLADPLVAAALAGASGVRTVPGPHGRQLSAFRPIAGLGWTVSSSVPTSTALAGIGTLRATVTSIAAGLALLLLLGALALARSLLRRSVAEAELAKQASINSAVLDGVRDGIGMMGPDGPWVFANARMREIGEEVFGLDGNLDPVYEEVATRLVDPARYLGERQVELENPDAELLTEFQLADSRRSFLRFSAPVADEHGGRLGRLVVVREVTAEREAEQLKSDLVATVSHELRTPLTGVLGFAELLGKPGLDTETREHYASTIYTEALRLTRLINDFLDLQRIEASALTLALESVDVRTVISHVVEVFRGEGGHVFELDLPDEALDVAADPERLTQVLANLISNATKYSPDGGAIRVSAEIGDGVVRVSVCDVGIGVPADQQRFLFTKFFRVDSSDTRSIGGTGLGLSLAREIVEAHGGRIGVESVEGEGSTFWFELPRGERRTGARPRVLVVEDDPGAAELLVEYLGDDFEVELAATGVSALERTHHRLPSVVCLDIGLPGDLSGWQVLANLKRDPRTAQVPVIVCTGANGRKRAGALGAADFLTKPFTREQLFESVVNLLPERGADVLVVDDEPTVRNLVAATLESEGHGVREAADGEEALEAISERRPDAIVLDLVMPRLDGFAVLERLQSDAELRAIPVLVLTAHRLTPLQRETLRARAVSLLEKSDYSATELRRLVDQALGRQVERV